MNTDVRYGILIRNGFLKGDKLVLPSYEIGSFAACPLGHDTCRCIGGRPTFCTRASLAHGTDAACICGVGAPRARDVTEFGDVIKNFAGGELLRAIMDDLARSGHSH